jgi:hypothetical protein
VAQGILYEPDITSPKTVAALGVPAGMPKNNVMAAIKPKNFLFIATPPSVKPSMP